MNRETYLRILRAQLTGRMPAGEREDILCYYEEYFEDAGTDREASVMAELGSPEHLARQILDERSADGLVAAGDGRRQAGRAPGYAAEESGKVPGWAFVLAAVLLAAVTLPVWGGLLAGLSLAGMLCVFAGLGTAASGFSRATLAAGLYNVGGGLMTFAMGVLLVLAVVMLVWLAVRGVRWLWRNLVEGRANDETDS